MRWISQRKFPVSRNYIPLSSSGLRYHFKGNYTSYYLIFTTKHL
ncbi:unnamed protein product, partial [Heterotrigona itama]